MTEIFKTEVFDGHLLLAKENSHFLLDTGSPVSLCNEGNFEFMGAQVRAYPNFAGKSLDQISEMVGTHIDVLLGMDVMAKYCVLIDTANQTTTFSDEPSAPEEDATIVPVEKSMLGVPAFQALFHGEQIMCILDTGAKISYLSKSLTANAEAIEVRDDFSPLLGNFTTPIFREKICIQGRETACEFGNLPLLMEKALAGMGIQCILGHDLFSAYAVKLDFPRKRIELL